jgi:hypothetical protein
MVRYCTVWYGIVRSGTDWYGIVWSDMVLYGLVRPSTLRYGERLKKHAATVFIKINWILIKG